MTGSLTELIERYVDALIQDPQAFPPPGLDDTDAAFVRDMLRARPVPPTDDALRARIWQRALSAAIAERLASSKTTCDTVDTYPTARASSNTNGRYQEETQYMSTMIHSQPYRARRLATRRNFWTFAATAAAIMVVVVGLLLALYSDEPPVSLSVGSVLTDTAVSDNATRGDATASPTVGSLGSATTHAELLAEYVLAPGSHVEGFGWKPDDARQLFWASDGTVGLADAASGQFIVGMLGSSDPSGDPFDGGAWSPDGLRIMVWRAGGTVRVWDLMTTAITEFEHGRTRLFGARWSRDGTQIVTWAADNAVRVWDAATGEKLLTLPHFDTVNGATWNPDGSRLLTWSENGYLYHWDARTGEKLMEAEQAIIPVSGDPIRYVPVTGVTWSADGSTLLSWSAEGYVFVWDYASWEHFPTVQYYAQFGPQLSGAVLNPVDNRIICWSDYAVYVNKPSFDGPAQMLLHEGAVGGAAWSADGTRILSWSEDATARVWDAATVTQIAQLHHGQRVVQGARWSADGTRIFTWSGSTVWTWELTPGTSLPPTEVPPTAPPSVTPSATVSLFAAPPDQPLIDAQATATQIVADALATAESVVQGTPLNVTSTATPTATVTPMQTATLTPTAMASPTHTATPLPN